MEEMVGNLPIIHWPEHLFYCLNLLRLSKLFSSSCVKKQRRLPALPVQCICSVFRASCVVRIDDKNSKSKGSRGRIANLLLGFGRNTEKLGLNILHPAK